MSTFRILMLAAAMSLTAVAAAANAAADKTGKTADSPFDTAADSLANSAADSLASHAAGTETIEDDSAQWIIEHRIDSIAGIVVHFPAWRSNLEPDFYLNASALTRLDSLLKDPMSQVAVDSVVITAYTSPEGSIAHNLRLSAHRSKSFKNYITQHFPLVDDKEVRISARYVDWPELRNLVYDDQTMPYRHTVLDILAIPDISDVQTLALLKAIDKGAAFGYVVRKYGHVLRRTTVTLFYSRSWIMRPKPKVRIAPAADEQPPVMPVDLESPYVESFLPHDEATFYAPVQVE
ncbi:MAG: hypothetical protein LBH06_00215 [Rikenellaceae bacterium]|nr:hypothetical protein [Rikenellaceae bacterium]